MTKQQKLPDLFLSLPHECGYLPGRQATSLFVDPGNNDAAQHYSRFLQSGFRRSGRLIYRPHCQSCNECVSVRISVNDFVPRRGQRRILNRNSDLVVFERQPYFSDEQFQLYRKYQHSRHTNGSMDHEDRNAYDDFLVKSPVDTRFFEFRVPGEQEDGRLLALAVTDVVDNGLSAVYTFFDPEESRRGLGVYAILWQIQQAEVMGLKYLYLGYWIRNCRKMSYKTDYQPLEAWRDDMWRPLVID
ncbi:MAG: arginyltransferase [Acidiferrobacterales bacterium]